MPWEIFEILSVHKTRIPGNFHLALPPIIGGPRPPGSVRSQALIMFEGAGDGHTAAGGCPTLQIYYYIFLDPVVGPAAEMVE